MINSLEFSAKLEDHPHLPRLREESSIGAPDLAILFEIAALDRSRRKIDEDERVGCKTRQGLGSKNMNREEASLIAAISAVSQGRDSLRRIQPPVRASRVLFSSEKGAGPIANLCS
jgi:hypothetical protein